MKVIASYFYLKIFSELLDLFRLTVVLFLTYSDASNKTWIFAECPGIKKENLPLVGGKGGTDGSY